MTSFEKLCGNCVHQNCCTNSAEPILFSHDLKKLETIGKKNELYLQEIKVNNKKVDAIKKKKNSSICVFWDEEKKQCSVYENRPFDCRAYPFDILLIDGKYHWIVYSCNPDSNWEWSEDFLQMLENDEGFNEIMENIEIFAGNTKRVLQDEGGKTPYTVLREVNYKR